MINKNTLISKTLVELRDMGKELGVKSVTTFKKDQLVEEILKQLKLNEEENIQAEAKEEEADEERKTETVEGVLELLPDGYGFLRANNFAPSEDDTYVSPVQIRRFRLKTGDYVVGIAGDKRDKEKFSPLIFVNTVNGSTPDFARNRTEFEDLTPIYPKEKIVLEDGTKDLSSRIIDLVAPIGRGSRGMIVSPPKVGKTTLIKSIANSIVKAYPEIHVIILLIDERPEEVTDIERSVQGERVEVIASTFDELPDNHVAISEFVLERAKRLVEHEEDVVILLDSITRLTRAYNIVNPSSGKILSGGLDPTAFHRPKRFFGAARNIEGGGSLTILATALIETGSRMDDVIFEEFKGTGNMEIHLDRELSNVRIFPAIDIYKSGTRREDLLQSEPELEAMLKIRRSFSGQDKTEVAETIIKTLSQTSSNDNFIQIVLESDMFVKKRGRDW